MTEIPTNEELRDKAWSRIDTTKTIDTVSASELRGWLVRYCDLSERLQAAERIPDERLATVELVEGIAARAEAAEQRVAELEAAERDALAWKKNAVELQRRVAELEEAEEQLRTVELDAEKWRAAAERMEAAYTNSVEQLEAMRRALWQHHEISYRPEWGKKCPICEELWASFSETPTNEELVEQLAREFHAVYQAEAKRQGDVRHHDDYDALPENIKEFDRVLARHVSERLQAAELWASFPASEPEEQE